MYLNQTKENMYANIIKEKNEEIQLLNKALKMKTRNYDDLLEMFNDLKRKYVTLELQYRAKERPEEKYMSIIQSTDRASVEMQNRIEYLERSGAQHCAVFLFREKKCSIIWTKKKGAESLPQHVLVRILR